MVSVARTGSAVALLGLVLAPAIPPRGFPAPVPATVGAAAAQEPDTSSAGDPAADPTTAAPDDERSAERAERARREAGLRAGVFRARGLARLEGVESSQTPVVEGYFQKGLDKHLALESSIGFWRRTQWREGEGGFLGGGGREEVTSYLLPFLTAVKMYPFTAPGDGFEPYLTGGVGFALGIDDRENASGGFLGVGGGGTAFVTGFGFKAGLGIDTRLGAGFGLGAGARYQWTRFGADVGGNRTYGGWALDGGLVYRFQY